MTAPQRALRALVASATAVTLGMVAAPVTVGAGTTNAPRPAPLDGRDQSGRIVGASDALRGVAVTGTAYAGPGARLVAADRVDSSARAAAVAAHAELDRLRAEHDVTTTDLSVDEAAIATLSDRHESETRAVVDISVRRYVDGPSTAWLDPALSPEVLAADQSTRSNLRNATTEVSRRLHRTTLELTSAVATLARHTRHSGDLDRSIAEAVRGAQSADDAAGRAVEQRQAAFDSEGEARLGTTVTGTDLTLVALDAYWRASVAEAATHPACRVPWWALAAIGRTESHHGGARAPDGSASPGIDGLPPARILGPPLTGSNGTRLIPDSEGGWIDGDTAVDRAVGPMQFLPGTWRTHGMDGSGDGVADLDNLYDAVRAAAGYLCDRGVGLDTDPGLTAAFTAYSGSAAYAAVALPLAHQYEVAVVIAPVQLAGGATTGGG